MPSAMPRRAEVVCHCWSRRQITASSTLKSSRRAGVGHDEAAGATGSHVRLGASGLAWVHTNTVSLVRRCSVVVRAPVGVRNGWVWVGVGLGMGFPLLVVGLEADAGCSGRRGDLGGRGQRAVDELLEVEVGGDGDLVGGEHSGDGVAGVVAHRGAGGSGELRERLVAVELDDV